jgi:hypothetical protein
MGKMIVIGVFFVICIFDICSVSLVTWRISYNSGGT